MPTKFFLKSKTILGGILMFVPTVCVMLGIEAPSAEELQGLQVNLEQVLMGLSELIGLVLVVYGRWVATEPIGVTGGSGSNA